MKDDRPDSAAKEPPPAAQPATGADYPRGIRLLGAVALFASMTNIVSGFLITDRMLKMFKSERKPADRK